MLIQLLTCIDICFDTLVVKSFEDMTLEFKMSNYKFEIQVEFLK
jgi:hypothetical protein